MWNILNANNIRVMYPTVASCNSSSDDLNKNSPEGEEKILWPVKTIIKKCKSNELDV